MKLELRIKLHDYQPLVQISLNSSTYTAIDGISITGVGNISIAYFTEDGSSFMVANVEA